MLHTKGKWKALPNGQVNSRWGNIAQTYRYKGEIEIKEQMANTNLIALAPELIDLLIRISFVINVDKDGGYFICEEAKPEVDELFKLVKELPNGNI